MSNLQVRTISAIVLAIVVLVLTWLGGPWFRLLSAVIGACVFFEWTQMSRRSTPRRWSEGGLGILPEVLLAIFLVCLLAGVEALTLIGLGVALAVLLAIVTLWRKASWWEFSGLVYAMLSAAPLALLRGDNFSGFLAIIFLFAVVWSTDISAYFVGKAVGGPKLAPSISPGKTRSGAMGGAAGAVIAGIVVVLIAGTGNLPLLALAAFLLSIVSQAGDLFESWVKRRHGAKDSGWLIPGHGGVMDRVDGLVVAALALYLIGWAAGEAGSPSQALFPV